MDNVNPNLISDGNLISERGSVTISKTAREILEALGVGVVLFDSHLRIVDASPLAGRLLTLEAAIDATLSKGTDGQVWNHWTEILHNAVVSGVRSEFQAVRYTAGEAAGHLHLTCIPVRNGDPATPPLGALIVEEASRPSEQTYKQAHAERLAAVGKVAGRVAHELNNPLDGILRYVNLAIRVLEQQQVDKAMDYLGHCRSGLRRMTQILSELLEFSRSTHLTLEQAPLDRLVEDALRTLEPSLTEVQVQMHRRYTGPALPVRSDSLFQVFCNLIKNAADAMEGKGRLIIVLCKTGHEWTVSFQDTGPGFAAEHAEEMFRPFFTTKPYGRGTGLGLSICRDLLEKLGGRITAENVPEGGSRFTVSLPHEDSEQKG